MSGNGRDEFRSRIGGTLGVAADRVTLFAKGRVALYAILRVLDVEPGDEVILPAFTCVAVPNAILYAGARPVYVDIDAATYTIDPVAVKAAITPRTRVILAQNTFGLSADLDPLIAVAADHGIAVVDDCTQGLGGRYRGRPNGVTAPVSFFSTQWSKPISTGLGGFAVAQDAATAARLRRLEEAAREPSVGRTIILLALLFGRERAGGGPILRAGRRAYRALSWLGVVPGSSSRDELEAAAMPHDFVSRLSESQARLGSARMSGLSADVERRRSIAHRYSEWLSAKDRTAATEPAEADHAFLRYPLRVNDRIAFAAAAERAGVDLGDWFVSPIHPVLDHLDRWGYVVGAAATAERACREIVNLPLDRWLRDRDVKHVLTFLADHVDLIR
jgi:perosamine synthetase